MSDTMNPDSWLTDKSDGRRFMIACATGLLLEAAALAILLPVMTHQSPPPAETQSIVKLSIIAPTPPAPLAPPPKPQPVTPPKQVTPPLPPAPPLPMAPPLPPAPPLPVAPNRPVIHHPPPRHLQPTPVPPPVAQVPQPPTSPMPAPPPAPVAPAQPSAGEIDLFQARMAEAVQRAATADYPEAAQMAHENGEVALSFVFQDGRVSNVAILQSSGFPMLDSAAMQAVRDARYPQQPADFAGRPHTVRVIVRFQTAPAEVDGD
jgi:protein TonB